MTVPNRAGIIQHSRQCGQALALDGWPPTTRSSRWCGRIKIGIEAQTGDDADMISDGSEEVDGGECGVADDDDATVRQPAMDL